jgi:hypothetical protein
MFVLSCYNKYFFASLTMWLISCTFYARNFFKNALAYFVTGVSYEHKMFMKSTTGFERSMKEICG